MNSSLSLSTLKHIQSNASEGEKSSPFYLANQTFCEALENYVDKNNGKIKGKFNAWSYYVYAEVYAPNKWSAKYKKSTFSTTGNLLLSPKHEALVHIVEWTTQVSETNDDFYIRKRRFGDKIRMLFSKSLKPTTKHPTYLLKTIDAESKLILALLETLNILLLSKEIYQISVINNILKIELRTNQHHFKYLDKLRKLNLQ